ncbi:MAG: hypothetical protein LBL06_04685 [Treponema sp.]|jgi:putative lipoprotein (rSAM/lipoprotein system)|nr:hypothetical protein [Treponema sp.]
MKDIKRIGRKVLRRICAGLGITSVAFIFQACYGTPQATGFDVLIRGVVKSKTNGSPIKGIKVSANNLYSYEKTDEDGEFHFYIPKEDCTIRFEDIDGKENGLYLPKEIPIKPQEDEMTLGDILLNEAE